MKALIIVPPGVRYSAGPLAGPAALAGVDPEVSVLDLNIQHLRRFIDEAGTCEVVGDHAKPAAGLSDAAAELRAAIEPALGPSPAPQVAGEDSYTSLWFSHESVNRASRALADNELGPSWDAALPDERPRLVGLSVMFAGQVVPALALAILVRRRWPNVPIVMGGAHVTALAPWIRHDARYGEHIDGFVAGYAESTFRAMLSGPPLAAPGVFRAGGGLAPRALDEPGQLRFEDLDRYGIPHLTLPAQTSRGCAFGRCTFCTYPAQEGTYRRSSLDLVEPTVRLASRLNADVSFKDAYLVPKRLEELAELIDGRVRWSGCTRLVPRLGHGVLDKLDASGCRTLEIGVESLDPETLRRVNKRQLVDDLEALLDDAAGTSIHLVLNMMFGFPGQSASDAIGQLRWLEDRCHGARVSTERNLLQIQRHSQMGRNPSQYGITTHGPWPWASTLPWDAPAWRDDLGAVLTGHHQEG